MPLTVTEKKIKDYITQNKRWFSRPTTKWKKECKNKNRAAMWHLEKQW